MMAPDYHTFTGRDGEVIPRHVTHVLIAKALKFVPARAFEWHPNIEEVICRDGVEKVEKHAFWQCPRLQRVIMPGVKVIEASAFFQCFALTYIECGKLERIGQWAFHLCESLSSIDLPSIKIVEMRAFSVSRNLTHVKFGKDLETIGERAFFSCTSLQRIALPLKNGRMADDNTFQECENLNHVDLVEGSVLRETVATLLMEEWKNDMNEEIQNISQILPNTPAGSVNPDDVDEPGRKARMIRRWIRSVLRKIVDYKAEHRRHLNVAATALQAALPNDIVLKNVLPFLELPSYTFEGEN